MNPRLPARLIAMTAAALTLAGGLNAARSATPAAAAPALSPQATASLRHNDFKKMGGAMKDLRAQLAAATPDKAAMTTSAQVILANAHEVMRLFPTGTGPGPGIKTDALPAIWTNRAEFDAQMARLQSESAKLVSVTGSSDAAAAAAQYKALGAVCGACHRQFRAPD